ncbi:hypothetical protein [Lachnobacterium bovis]|uniref:hypothetical protein n=1 Tax=Lachnobacterium bovis TaxID=140626 RepID=UPI00048933B3|nr:hypothetical protein [Lachnobacterium bovis]
MKKKFCEITREKRIKHKICIIVAIAIMCIFFGVFFLDAKLADEERLNLDKNSINDCKNYQAVKLTTTSVPNEIGVKEKSSTVYSTIEVNKKLYILESEEDELANIKEEIQKHGKYVIKGAVSEISEKKELYEFLLRKLYEWNGKDSDSFIGLRDIFGEYYIVNESTGESKIGFLSRIAFKLLKYDVLFLVYGVLRVMLDRKYGKYMKRYTEYEREKIDAEVCGGKKEYIGKIYLTPTYFVSDLVAVPYEDICWMYCKTIKKNFIKASEQLVVSTIDGFTFAVTCFKNRDYDPKILVMRKCLEKNPNIAIGYDRHKKARYSKLKKEIRRLKREGKDPIKEYRNKDFVVYFG